MVKHYVIYDLATGHIHGKLILSNPEQAKAYENILEITEEEATKRPEIDHIVDLETKTLKLKQ